MHNLTRLCDSEPGSSIQLGPFSQAAEFSTARAISECLGCKDPKHNSLHLQMRIPESRVGKDLAKGTGY